MLKQMLKLFSWSLTLADKSSKTLQRFSIYQGDTLMIGNSRHRLPLTPAGKRTKEIFYRKIFTKIFVNLSQAEDRSDALETSD